MQLISRGTNPTKFRREEQQHERHRKLCYNHSHREYPPIRGQPVQGAGQRGNAVPVREHSGEWGSVAIVCSEKLFQNQPPTSLDIQQILSEEKPNQQEVMKISAERLQAVLPQGLNTAETEDYAIKACEHYRKFQRRREQER